MRNRSAAVKYTLRAVVWLSGVLSCADVNAADDSTWSQHRGNAGSTGVSTDDSVKPVGSRNSTDDLILENRDLRTRRDPNLGQDAYDIEVLSAGTGQWIEVGGVY